MMNLSVLSFGFQEERSNTQSYSSLPSPSSTPKDQKLRLQIPQFQIPPLKIKYNSVSGILNRVENTYKLGMLL